MYMIYRTSVGINSNNFTENSAGQKGTAVYTRDLHNVFIKDNDFRGNQPMYSWLENEWDGPFYKKFLKEVRKATFD